MAPLRTSRTVSALVGAFVLALALILIAFWINSPNSEAEPDAHPTSGDVEIPWATGSGRILLAVAGPRSPESYLHVIAIDGSGHRRLTTSAGSQVIVGDGSPASSPDGRRIAFVRALYEVGGRGTSHVHVAAFDGRRVHRVTTGTADEMSPAWAPDGRRLVFARSLRTGFGLVVARLGGHGLRVLVHPTKTMTDATFPAWSPDGSKIAFTAYVDDNEDIYVVNADGSGPAPLLEGPYQDSHPAWSPDGRRLTFVRGGDIYTMNADGTNIRAVTLGRDEDSAPQWSADGRSLLFTRGDGRVLIAAPDGTALAQVPLDAPALGAAWASP